MPQVFFQGQIPGRTSQGSRSPRSRADIRYRHIPEIGEQSRTIPLAHVHGRKPKNYGDIYNVRTTGGGGQGYTPRAPHPSLSIANRVSTLCPLFGSMDPICVRMVTNEESEKSAKMRVLTRKTPIYRGLIWWRVWGSNPRPLECHSSALPTELTPQHVMSCALRFVPPRSTIPSRRSTAERSQNGTNPLVSNLLSDSFTELLFTE